MLLTYYNQMLKIIIVVEVLFFIFFYFIIIQYLFTICLLSLFIYNPLKYTNKDKLIIQVMIIIYK